jgi:Arylsulfatase A and related enzymes
MEKVDQSASGPYNIVFILTDQERHFRPDELPKDYRLPAHERLAKSGVVFENHRINSCVCTSSRSVIYTGLHIQQTRMFDNTNFPWMQSMSTDIKTIGHHLREAGYYTAYKGKWHLTRGIRDRQHARGADQDLHQGDGSLWLFRLPRGR